MASEAPESSAATAAAAVPPDDAWTHSVMAVDDDGAQSQVMASCETCLAQCGGPSQYLQRYLRTADEGFEFMEWLREQFPEQDDTLYHQEAKLPCFKDSSDLACAAPTCVHVSSLGFTSNCSLKPGPGAGLATSLLQEFLKDGFVTAGDPLLVLQHEACVAPYGLEKDSSKLQPFNLAYLKGFARSATLLMLLHRCKALGLNGSSPGLAPLWSSVTRIWVHCMESSNRIDEALTNMKLSSRGSLRKANNLIQLVFMLQNLKSLGLSDSSSFVQRWNKMSSKTFQIVGRKASALKLLLEQTPQSVLTLILDHVNMHGWESCVWSDDNLGSKKIFSGFQFSCSKKSWLPRLRTTDESMMLMVKFLQACHEQKASYMRKKPDTQAVEDAAVKAALCWHLGQELLQQVPVDPNKLQAEWYDNFASGENSVDGELQALLMDKSDTFDVKRDCPSLRKLVEDHKFSKPVAMDTVEEVSLQVDKFALIMKQLKYDVQVYTTWTRKVSSVKSAQEHQRHMWLLERRKRCLAVADQFLSRNVKLLVWQKKVELAIAEIMNAKRDVTQKLSVPADEIYTLVWWNVTSPCLIPAHIYQQSVSLLAWALNDQMKSMALVLMPTFSYSKGKLVLEESQLLQKLSAGNHNIDWQWHLLFSERSDARDLRPLVYTGRFVFPSPLELQKNPWFSCDLRKTQRTVEQKQLAAKEMREVECVAEDSLPTTTDTRDILHGAPKYWQVGSTACSAVLTSAFTGVQPEPGATLVLDLYPRNGDMCEAFCDLRSHRNNVQYIALCESQDEALYIENYMKESLSQAYEAGKSTPNGEKIEQKMSDDLVEATPPAPNMNLLVTCLLFFG